MKHALYEAGELDSGARSWFARVFEGNNATGETVSAWSGIALREKLADLGVTDIRCR